MLPGLVTLGAAAAPETAPAAGAGLPHEFWTAGFYLLLFAGCTLLAAVLGLVSSWIDRKVTALVQARIGPPLLQPFYDFVKLLGKETLIPAGANRMAFLLMPLVALAGVSLAATVLLGNIFWQNGLIGSYGFVGDLVVVLYLLAVPSIALVIGASSSNNPFASVGASRELKLLMSYELPMLLSVIAVLTLASGAEVRFTREAQSQVDARLGAKSLLVSSDGARRVLKARQDRLRRLQEKLSFAQEAAARERKNRKRAGELREELSDLRLLVRVAQSKEARDLQKEIRGKSKYLTNLNKQLAAVKTVGALEQSVKEARGGVAEFGMDVGRFREERPLVAKVPLRLKRILTMRLAGPMPDERLMLVDAVVDKVGQVRRNKDRQLENVKLAIKAKEARRDKLAISVGGNDSGVIQLTREIEELRDRVPRLKQEHHSINEDAKRLGGVEGETFRLDGAALVEAARGRFLDRWVSGFVLALCVLVVLVCAQAKLGLVPFDCAEADTELAGGVLIEYGGPPLAVWKLVKAMMLFTVPVFIGVIFLGGFRFYVPGGEWGDHFWQVVASLAKYVLILVFFILVRNTNPRVRVDQAMRFFLVPMTILASIALILAVMVHWMSVG